MGVSDETMEEMIARFQYTLRVLRGGGFANSDSNLRGAVRDGDNPAVVSDVTGFAVPVLLNKH